MIGRERMDEKNFKFEARNPKFETNSKTRTKYVLYIWPFEIGVCFACLREAVSAKAGISKLGFWILIQTHFVILTGDPLTLPSPRWGEG
jgi:hypothetical protein